MGESRLFQLLYYLMDWGQATAPELAQRLEVSVRTIYRDIDALSQAGIPVYSEPGRGGGIRLLRRDVLDQVLLSGEEKRELLAALQSLNALGGPAQERLLTKLSALFREESSAWYQVDLSRWGGGRGDNEKFQALKQAILHRQVTAFRYVSAKGEARTRQVYPLRMVYRGRAWYLLAYDSQREGPRLFKLTRILELQLLDAHFPPTQLPQEEEEGEGESPMVTLRFPREMAYRVYDDFTPDQVARQPDGTFLVQAPMPQDAWLVGWLLSFGAQVEVLAPAELRRALAQAGKKIFETYKP